MFESLSEYVDGELDESMCEQIQLHMQDCVPCKTFLASLRRSIEISKLPDKTVESPPPLPDDVKSALRVVLKKKING